MPPELLLVAAAGASYSDRSGGDSGDGAGLAESKLDADVVRLEDHRWTGGGGAGAENRRRSSEVADAAAGAGDASEVLIGASGECAGRAVETEAGGASSSGCAE